MQVSHRLKRYTPSANDDSTSDAVSNVTVWTNIEPCAAVICACLPTYGSFLRNRRAQRKLTRLFRNRTSGSSRANLFKNANGSGPAVDRNDGESGRASDSTYNIELRRPNKAEIR